MSPGDRERERIAKVKWQTGVMADEEPEVGPGKFTDRNGEEWDVLEVWPVPRYPGQWGVKLERDATFTDYADLKVPPGCCRPGGSKPSRLTRNLRPGDRIKVRNNFPRTKPYHYWVMVVVGAFRCGRGRRHVVAVKERAPADCYCFDYKGEAWEFSGEAWWIEERMRPRVKAMLEPEGNGK